MILSDIIGQQRLPENLRLYVVGDIHGCLEQLKQLSGKINQDAEVTTCKVRLIFLGDYIDRGLYSKQTIDYLIDLRTYGKYEPIFLMGNHEQVMRNLLRNDDQQLLFNWFGFGGRETLMSYGINPASLGNDPRNIFRAMAEKVPAAHLTFLDNLDISVSFGDYFFCHAGVKPNVKLAEQKEQDLTWIRHEFLDYQNSFEKIIVHGHTITHDVQFLPNRIGIDTGAYATGCLTALALEGTKKWVLQTGED